MSFDDGEYALAGLGFIFSLAGLIGIFKVDNLLEGVYVTLMFGCGVLLIILASVINSKYGVKND